LHTFRMYINHVRAHESTPCGCVSPI
jgi:hypothetical protein